MRARVQRLTVLLVSNDVPLAFGCEELERQQNPLALAMGSIRIVHMKPKERNDGNGKEGAKG
jgi:hypothetical protein